MALTTDYASLQTNIADWLIRTDLTNAIKVFIQNFESKAKRDYRVRRLKDRGTFTITGDGDTVPSDIISIESWYHNGATYFGPLEIVNPNSIGELKAIHGSSGVPIFAAMRTPTEVIYAPAPDGNYDTQMVYWATLTELSDTNTTNWLLNDHPDIYLYGSLVESAPYMRDDERLVVWKSELEERLERLHALTQSQQFGGALRRQVPAIG
jgi:hypothetical protein